MNRLSRVLLILGVLLLSRPEPLDAHARLTRAEPAAGAIVAPPSVIRLWFSESPELRFSSIVLKDSSGRAIGLGTVVRGDSANSIQASVSASLRPGTYTVTWRVAAADGHPTSGSFEFTVLEAAAPPAVAAPDSLPRERIGNGSQGANASESIAWIVARAIGFAALLILIGAAATRFAILGRGPAVHHRPSVERRLASVGAAAAVVAIVAGGARLLLQWRMLNSGGLPAIHLSTVTMSHWGHVWVFQAAAVVLAAVGFLIARRGRASGWAIVAVAALVLSVAPGLGGHAGAATERPVLSLLADGLHVLGASAWLGTLFCLAFVVVPSISLSGSDDRWAAIAAVINTFSSFALSCAAIVVLTGVVNAWLRLGSFSVLWTSQYGRVLLVKLAVVAAVLIVGAYNWLRIRPSLGTDGATVRLRRSMATELTVGAVIVIITAVLVAVPTPLA